MCLTSCGGLISAALQSRRQRYWFLVFLDDYSRFIVAAEQVDHDLTTFETVAELMGNKPVSEGYFE